MIDFLIKLFKSMDNNDGTCACCGRCCEEYGGHLHAYQSDLLRWKKENRGDLLQRVNRLGWIWVDPETKQPLNRCPFIHKTEQHLSICLINETKPQICKDYPTMEHGKRCIRETKKEKYT